MKKAIFTVLILFWMVVAGWVVTSNLHTAESGAGGFAPAVRSLTALAAGR